MFQGEIFTNVWPIGGCNEEEFISGFRKVLGDPKSSGWLTVYEGAVYQFDLITMARIIQERESKKESIPKRITIPPSDLFERGPYG